VIRGIIVAEPTEQMYREFVSVLASMAERFLLVQRSLPIRGITLEEEEIFANLAPWCVLMEDRADWPGTTHGPNARAVQPIYECATAPGAIAVLQQTVSGLYEWLTPRPEDLAFLRTDGSVILYSVAHEREAELSLTSSERDVLVRKWPGVAPCVKWTESV
jgi:hypothetical protein